MSFDLTVSDLISIGGQLALIVTYVVVNRQTILGLKQQHEDMKNWVKEIQNQVIKLRVKVGE